MKQNHLYIHTLWFVGRSRGRRKKATKQNSYVQPRVLVCISKIEVEVALASVRRFSNFFGGGHGGYCVPVSILRNETKREEVFISIPLSLSFLTS